MPSELPHDPRPKSTRRTSNLVMTMVVIATCVLAFLALLPVIGTVIVVALWGLGGSGSNK
jgi:hypothetical protein